MPKRDGKPRRKTDGERRAGDGKRSDRGRAGKAPPSGGTTSAGAERRQSEGVSDGLVLAAVDRAYRHRSTEGSEVPFWNIIDHLAIAKRTNAARDVRARLVALQIDGLLHNTRRHGVVVWGLTWGGKRRLERELRSTNPPRLPESPQHRAWRAARDLARQEIERFRDTLRVAAHDAVELTDADPPAHSDAWFVLAKRLQRAAWVLGSATHCLHEWREPSDERADVDRQEEPGEGRLADEERRSRRARRAGRRNTVLWREQTSAYADSKGGRDARP